MDTLSGQIRPHGYIDGFIKKHLEIKHNERHTANTTNRHRDAKRGNKMKLSQILIEAGVTPGIDAYYNFICQFNNDSHEVYFYIEHCVDGFTFHRKNIPLAEDWQTPLSREQFIADYEAHCAKRP